MESTNQEMTNLADLQKTLADATEILAEFISVRRSDEQPIDSLLGVADTTLKNLAG